MQQTVLITGGTGLVGQALTQALIEKGYKVIILTRKMPGTQEHPHISYAVWNVKTQEMDITALQQADHIIHLAGAPVVAKKWTAAYRKEIQESRTQSSRLIVESLKNNANKVKAVISASAIGWYGTDTNPATPFTEDMPADHHFLGDTCRLWEESIEPVTGLGKRLVKLRIGIVLGNGGGALEEFKKPLRFGVAAVLGSGRQIVSWIHIDDLCSLFIAGIENEILSGSYNAVAPNPVSNKVLTLALAKAMKGSSFITMPVPVFVLKLIMGERSIEVLKSTTVSSKKVEDAGFGFRFSTIDEAMINLATTDRH